MVKIICKYCNKEFLSSDIVQLKEVMSNENSPA